MEAVAHAVRVHQVTSLVVDPVLVATSGDSLAGNDVAAAIVEQLFPLATVVTPNIPEASVMLGKSQCRPPTTGPAWVGTALRQIGVSAAVDG